MVLRLGQNSCYKQVGYGGSTDTIHKFLLLSESKYSNLSNLPPCKIIKADMPKFGGGGGLPGVSMAVDRVLQQMFLTFIDVIVEDTLKPNVFAFRKGRNARMAVAAVYSKLNRFKYINDVSVCSLDLENCFDDISHSSIISNFPFPLAYKSLLVR